MSEPLSTEERTVQLNELDGWTFEDDKIHKEYTFSDFREAVGFLMRVAFEAEEQVHHPEIFNVYNTVKLSLSTHDAGGKVTEKDIALAKKIDSITS